MPTPTPLPLSLLRRFLCLHLITLYLTAARSPPSPLHSPLPPDAVALLSFKSKADLDSKLLYALNERFDYCIWQGVKCVQGRVVRFVLQGTGLRGVFPADTLNRLDQLRILSLRNNSLSGPVPDLAGLVNLRSLFLDHNSFSGTFPPSLLYLHALIFLDLSHNNHTGPVPAKITGLDLLSYLRLDSNHFTGFIPPLNQSTLRTFNVSNNNFTGAVPVTATLSKFGISSFSQNPNLCGEIIHIECRRNSTPPFFSSPSPTAPSPPSTLAQSQGVFLSPPSPTKHKRVGVVLGFIIGALILVAASLCIVASCKALRARREHAKSAAFESESAISATETQAVNTEPETKHIKAENRRSGDLIFCGDEAQMYTLEQLMRASAELLGRGSIGTTYKAVMDGRITVSVKRLDAGKTAVTSGVMFERHMELMGALRHPNLVPVRAYFQAKEERLIIFDYQTNGSLFNLIHGSRSARAKPLHWTSCLKIADDVARGLAYIHQASQLVHGNLKSTNVLLGPDFEACLVDYSLSVLADPSLFNLDPDSERYKAPEIRKPARCPTAKSDVYAFGVILLELLTGKRPSQHPFLDPLDMADWVRAMREDDVEEHNQLGMLVDLASICSLTSPEQRPLMRQVLKMIDNIKERVVGEDHIGNGYSGN